MSQIVLIAREFEIMQAIDNNAKKQRSAARALSGWGEGEIMPDDDAGREAWAFARGTYELSRDLDKLTEDAARRVRRLSPQSQRFLDLLLDGNGNEDIAAITGLTPGQVDEARTTMLAELDVASITDAIRVGICADYLLPRDSSEPLD